MSALDASTSLVVSIAADPARGTLSLARDHLGDLKVYYHLGPRWFIAASEPAISAAVAGSIEHVLNSPSVLTDLASANRHIVNHITAATAAVPSSAPTKRAQMTAASGPRARGASGPGHGAGPPPRSAPEFHGAAAGNGRFPTSTHPREWIPA